MPLNKNDGPGSARGLLLDGQPSERVGSSQQLELQIVEENNLE